MVSVRFPKIIGFRDWSKFGWLATGLVTGVAGNMTYDTGKSFLSQKYFSMTHRTALAESAEGYQALVAADKANVAGDRAKAKEEYAKAIEKLTLAADGGVPRAMALLHEVYCDGRKDFVEENHALGKRWGADAAANGDKFGSNTCAD